jgi:hypothetical protein
LLTDWRKALQEESQAIREQWTILRVIFGQQLGERQQECQRAAMLVDVRVEGHEREWSIASALAKQGLMSKGMSAL